MSNQHKPQVLLHDQVYGSVLFSNASTTTTVSNCSIWRRRSQRDYWDKSLMDTASHGIFEHNHSRVWLSSVKRHSVLMQCINWYGWIGAKWSSLSSDKYLCLFNIGLSVVRHLYPEIPIQKSPKPLLKSPENFCLKKSPKTMGCLAFFTTF